MRHLKKKVVLDRPRSQRRALLANLAESLILHEKVRTTSAKAKALRPVIEKLITKAKKNNLAARREIMKTLYTPNAARKMMEVIGPKYAGRAGGYTRIIRLNNRVGDGAEESVIEFV